MGFNRSTFPTTSGKLDFDQNLPLLALVLTLGLGTQVYQDMNAGCLELSNVSDSNVLTVQFPI